jgi:hypothetical protein
MFSRLELHAKAPGFNADYSFEQAANGDVHATYNEDFGATRRGGEIVLFGVDGVAYRSREAFPDSDSIIDYMLSSPIMMSKLTTLLLDLGVLDSPAEVTKPRTITAGSATQYIRTEAPRIAALYGPPWKMTGTVRPTAEGPLAFTLRLDYRPVDTRGQLIKGRRDTVELDGTVAYTDKRPSLPDSLDLIGWKIMKRNRPLASASTLGEARALIGP